MKPNTTETSPIIASFEWAPNETMQLWERIFLWSMVAIVLLLFVIELATKTLDLSDRGVLFLWVYVLITALLRLLGWWPFSGRNYVRFHAHGLSFRTSVVQFFGRQGELPWADLKTIYVQRTALRFVSPYKTVVLQFGFVPKALRMQIAERLRAEVAKHPHIQIK